MTRRARRFAAPLAVALTAAATVAGCSEDDPRAALDNARYELVDIADVWTWAPRDHLEMGWEPPSGVDGLAGGGSTDPREADGDVIEPADLDLEHAARVHTNETGDIWVLTYGTVVHITDGRINHIYDNGDGPNAVTAIAVDAEGRLAATNQTSIVTFEPGDDEHRVVKDRSSAMRTAGIAFQHDGTLLGGGWFADRLVAITDDGTEHPLLDLPDDPDTTLGAIGFITVLSDGRTAVAPWVTEHELDIGVVADREVRPVGGIDEPRPPEDITSLAPAPDGRLLVTTPDKIDAVDVDTGESDTLVDLTGAEGTPSAAATGDDLVFLADGRLWRLPDAFS